MMEKTTLKAAITYESKLVKRNWLFYLFVLGTLGYILGDTLLDIIDYEYIPWRKFIFASSFPLYGYYFLSLIQSIIVTFIVCDIHRKRKKAETREVLSARPIGNGQSFLGEFLGILIPFLTIDVIFGIILMSTGILIPDSPVNLWINLFYLLTYVLPTLVFITGLSLLVNRLVRHSLVSWLILIVFLYFAYTYLTTPLHGIFDFRGSLLPNSFSTLVGFMHIENYLLQRGAVLLFGIGLLYFAVPFTKRQPDTPGKKCHLTVPAFLFLILAVGLGVIYVTNFQSRLKNRIGYRETFVKYDEHPKARVIEHDITYRPGGDKFSATSRMKIQNRKKTTMEQLLLFLNPGLKIDKIESGGQNLPFHRDRQVIVIERPLAPGENIELEIAYGGTIDEDIYQVNIPDDEFFSLRNWAEGENYGNRTAFVSDKYTLLLPQVMWYPMAVPPVWLQASKETDFTDYTLHVKNPGEMTVLSQGKPTREGDNVTFNNLQNLTGLTLCIGNYEKRAITVDSLTVELYTYPGNSFYMKYFDEWEALKKDNPDREKNLKEIFYECKKQIEYNTPIPYPFKYFKLIEVPSSSYFWTNKTSFSDNNSFSDNIQPEMTLFWERLCRAQSSHPGTFSEDSNQDESLEEYVLYRQMPAFLSRIGIKNIFSNYNSSLTSDSYQGIELIFKNMINPRQSECKISPKILNHFAEKGLKGIIAEGHSEQQSAIISLKVSHLLGYLATITTWDSLNRFTREFNERTRFREIDFDSFLEEFEQRFGQNIKGYMDEWYTSRRIPLLTIKDLSLKTTGKTRIIDFKVGNISETDGIVSLLITDMYGGITGYDRNYLIKPGEFKRIVIHENIEHRLELTTNFSGILPNDNILFSPGEFPFSGPVPKEGVTPIDRNEFYPPGEIIVDNEDENFQLIDSANNRKRLADLIRNEGDQEYVDPRNLKANAWNPILEKGMYGDRTRSAFVKKVGTGQFKAEWTANLPEAGKYEIFIYRPHYTASGRDIYTTYYPGMKNYYTVYTPKGKEEIILEVQEGNFDLSNLYLLPEEEAWISLGKFTLPAGESRVVLDDRGVDHPFTSEKYRYSFMQLVIADAVKWVKEK
ncbi:hypothetical protein [Gabonibacter chumensis]|uniref:hypothetical protein n=1 Tax=Gabonibacter chumensis TaxID=2972474 RepID=UPI0025728CB6|nr:hypothetical protein [Gabonibacter chumensis]MCR9011441.1 hypothetical protein [Gabonibacter chumensis]